MMGRAVFARPLDAQTTLATSSGAADEGDLWAVLIAGSAGWGNYRHQADVSHAYQVLRRGGLDPNRIITFMYDDIANNPANPHPGKIFNSPGGEDVYEGVYIDYRGNDVTSHTFLSVLAGSEELAASGRKVLATKPNDRVFVYYSDHGAPGILGMPSGPFLYADQLHAVIANRSRHNQFSEMVLYIEACESGSIFEGVLEDDLSVYATTAANGHESSWGTYCPGMDPSPPPEFSTCLGDLYSVAWLENADVSDLTIETLKKQFQLVKQRTSQNYTFSQGSHVMRFGSFEIAEEPAARFEGEKNDGSQASAPGANGFASAINEAGAAWASPHGAVEQRDADLLALWSAYARAPGTGGAKAAALVSLEREVSRRAAVDGAVSSALHSLLRPDDGSNSMLLAAVRAKLDGGPGRRLSQAAGNEEVEVNRLARLLASEALPRPLGAAVVDDWGCLRGMVSAWESACAPLDQYGMRHTRAFANLCNLGLSPSGLVGPATIACKSELRPAA